VRCGGPAQRLRQPAVLEVERLGPESMRDEDAELTELHHRQPATELDRAAHAFVNSTFDKPSIRPAVNSTIFTILFSLAFYRILWVRRLPNKCRYTCPGPELSLNPIEATASSTPKRRLITYDHLDNRTTVARRAKRIGRALQRQLGIKPNLSQSLAIERATCLRHRRRFTRSNVRRIPARDCIMTSM
jgi:hypothetical protein